MTATGMLMAGTAGAAGDNQATVTVSGQTILSYTFGSTATAGVYFYEDGDAGGREGTVRENDAGAFSQIDVATDWIRPTSAATTSYRIRYTSYTGDSPSSASITTSYQSINTDRWVEVQDNSPTFGGQSATFTIQIDDGTTLQDSASYTLTADREDF